MRQQFLRTVTLVVTIAFGTTGLVAPAQATIVGTQTYMAAAERAETVARVQAALDREAVQALVQRQDIAFGADADQRVIAQQGVGHGVADGIPAFHLFRHAADGLHSAVLVDRTGNRHGLLDRNF